jgi:hypothetical protein
VLEDRELPSAYYVNSIDKGAGLTLRDAIEQAELDGGRSSVIEFIVTEFDGPQTITLNAAEVELDLTGSITIIGTQAGVTIDAGGGARAFEVARGANATFSNSTSPVVRVIASKPPSAAPGC